MVPFGRSWALFLGYAVIKSCEVKGLSLTLIHSGFLEMGGDHCLKKTSGN